MNSKFAGWFIPGIIISLVLYCYQTNKRVSIEEYSLKKEINLRIRLAKDAAGACFNHFQKFPDSSGKDINNILFDYYESSFSNVLMPYPTYKGIDSVDYDGNLRNNSLYNLCSKYCAISNKNRNNIKSIQMVIDSLKVYLRFHINELDSATYYYYYITLRDGLKQLK
jgi:hypothetical protein